MKFSKQWLNEWLDLTTPLAEWSAQLTAAGLEVEEIIATGTHLDKVCVGEVLAVVPHPDSQRLNVCKVCIGTDTPELTIVCGAANVRAGLKVAVAQIGAVLPGDVQIAETTIRGIVSCGMICSSTELGLGEASTGILELPADAPIGMAFGEYFGLPDQLLDINLTPNRGDCLSVQGLARELSAVADLPLRTPVIKEISAEISDTLGIHLKAPDQCPRYTARMIKNISLSAKTPIWMQERLRRSQIRCIHPVVDVMNYVMLEYGQPLHAFDLSTIAGEIIVRSSEPGESVVLLDGQTITLEKPVLVIADTQKILALAGIMGGASGAVSATTGDILIESAHFTPKAIRPTLRALHLQSDAAHRFERGVDPELPLIALNLATALVLDIAGGQAGPVMDITDQKHLPKPKQINLRAARIARVLGSLFKDLLSKPSLSNLQNSFSPWEKVAEGRMRVFGSASPLSTLSHRERRKNPEGGPRNVFNRGSDEGAGFGFCSEETIQNLLTRLNLQPKTTTEGWQVTVPSYRFDLTVEIDLIEEIARLYGYTNIPSQTAKAPLAIQAAPETQLTLSRLRHYFADKGYHETINYSFVEPTLAKRLDPENLPLRLANPISADLSVMRTSLWPGLIQSAQFNLNRQQPAVRFFETGVCFLAEENQIKHIPRIAGIILGPATDMQWGLPTKAVDFFDLKGDLENLFALTQDPEFSVVPGQHPALHPGRCAQIQRAGKPIGIMGELHPEHQRALDLPMTAYLFELDLADLLPAVLPAYTNPSKYPSIRRDLAFIVDEGVSYQAIRTTMLDELAIEALQNIDIFDVYRGKNIPAGKKSMALSLTFQLTSRTLTDEEVETAVATIVDRLQTSQGAILRAE